MSRGTTAPVSAASTLPSISALPSTRRSMSTGDRELPSPVAGGGSAAGAGVDVRAGGGSGGRSVDERWQKSCVGGSSAEIRKRAEQIRARGGRGAVVWRRYSVEVRRELQVGEGRGAVRRARRLAVICIWKLEFYVAGLGWAQTVNIGGTAVAVRPCDDVFLLRLTCLKPVQVLRLNYVQGVSLALSLYL